MDQKPLMSPSVLGRQEPVPMWFLSRGTLFPDQDEAWRPGLTPYAVPVDCRRQSPFTRPTITEGTPFFSIDASLPIRIGTIKNPPFPAGSWMVAPDTGRANHGTPRARPDIYYGAGQWTPVAVILAAFRHSCALSFWCRRSLVLSPGAANASAVFSALRKICNSFLSRSFEDPQEDH